MSDLLSLFRDINTIDMRGTDRDKVVLRAPFGYPGGKSRSVPNLLKAIPYDRAYVEPFGGSMALLLARASSDLEVYNDTYGGVVCFYKCLRDNSDALIERLSSAPYAREEFIDCKMTWEQAQDPVERAAKWFYMVRNSFNGLGRNFARATDPSYKFPIRYRNILKEFPSIRERIQDVVIENLDWEQCVYDYESKNTVFYLDPTYLEVSRSTFKYELTQEDHVKVLDTVHKLNGFFAVSSYANDLYDSYEWDDVLEWDVHVSAKSVTEVAGAKKEDLVGQTRFRRVECLYILDRR
jgi:DNA adenine methylase